MGFSVRLCKLWSLLVFFLLVLGSVATFASPTQLTYQGRILKSDGTPLEYANVSFIFQITDPAGSCIIYQEQVTGYSMVNSGGVFDVPIGNGTVQFPLSGPSTVLDAFNNSSSFNCGVCSSSGGTYSCSTGSSTYTASSGDGRKLRVSFYDGSGWKTISPDSVIRSVPFAGYSLSAEKLGANTANDFLLKVGIPICSSGTFLAWDGSSLTCAGVAGASGGTVTNVTSGNSYITITNPTSTPQITLQVGTGANTVAAGNDARIVNAIQSGGTASGDLNGTYPGPKVVALQGVGIDSTTPTSNQILTFNGTKWAPASPSTSLPPSGSAGGDLSGTYPNPTLAKIGGVTLSISSLVSGNFLKYNGTNWINAGLSSADLSDTSNLIKAGQMPANCTANQTLTFSSPTGTWVCSSIAITGSAFGSQNQNLVLASPDGSNGTPTFRALASSDLPVGTLSGAGTAGYVPYYSATTALANSPLFTTSGNVGINTTAPATKFHTVDEGVGTWYNDNYSSAAGSNPALIGRKASGTAVSPSAVQSSQVLMFVGGRGYDGSAFTTTSKASITMAANENWSSTSQGSRITFTTTPNGSTTSAERMRIDNSGYVGIGTTTPSSLLEVRGGLTLSSSSISSAFYFKPEDQGGTYTNTADQRQFLLGTTGIGTDFGYKFSWRNADGSVRQDALTFVKDGSIVAGSNLAIGTTAPVTKFQISSATPATANYPLAALGNAPFDGTSTGFFTGNANGTVIGVNNTSSYTGDFLNFQIAGVPKFKVDNSGNITMTGNTTSSGNTTSTGNYSTSGNISTTGAGTVTSAGQLTANSGAASTSPTTGALIVNGGTGISGALNVGGTSYLGNSSANYVTISGTTTGNSPTIATAGSDTNINLTFNPKGTGSTIFTHGNVGIGTTSPVGIEHIFGTGSIPQLIIDRASGNYGRIQFATSGSRRWEVTASASSESGSNVGTDFSINRANDSGTFVDSPLTITRSTGDVQLGASNGLYVKNSNGYVGIGTASPNASLDVEQTQTQTTVGGTYGVLGIVNFSPASASSAGVAAGKFGTAYNGALASASASVYGVQGYAQNNSAYAINKAIGSYGEVDNLSTGSITQAMGTQGIISNASTGTIGTSYELYTQTSNSGTITNQYGIYQSTVSSKNYFAGNMGIGTSSPLYTLDITNATQTNYIPLSLYNGGTAAGLQHSTDLLFDQYDTNTSARSTYGKIRVQKNAAGSSSGFMSFYTNNAGTSTERMRLDSSGNLGLGTTSPTYQIDMQGSVSSVSQVRSVANANGPDIYLGKDRGSVGSPAAIQNGDALGNISFRGYDGSAYTRGILIQGIASAAPGTSQMTADLRFLTNNGSSDASERMRITSAGYVGIGTSAPQNVLDVRSYMQLKAAASAYDAGIILKSNGVSTSDTRFMVRLSPDSGKQGQFEILRFDPSTGSELERTTYDNSGNWNFPYCIRYNGGTSGTCASDIRLKKDIHTYNIGLDTLLKITPKNFKYNGLGGIADDGKEQLGVIAQDVEQASPTLVKTRKVKMHPEDKTETEIKAVDYNAFTYILINAVKELYAKWFSDSQAIHRDIASLKEENTQIKKENADIKAENAAIKSYLCQKDSSAPFCKKH